MARGNAPATGKFQRNPPSQALQQERRAWGAKYGPLVGGNIRRTIAEHDASTGKDGTGV